MDPLRKKALRMLMRPIVRFCLRGSNTIQDFLDLAKVVFVEVAADEIERTADKVNVSRISVMTGVHRRDVTRIYRDESEPIRSSPSVLTRVIGLWEGSRTYTTKSGKPRTLSCKGDDSEFHQLVRQVSTNIKPGTILFELERMGLVEKTARGVRLQKQVQRMGGEPEKLYDLLSRDVESLVSAVDENISANGESPNLHIRTEYDNIYTEDLPTIRSWLLEEGKEFHRRAREFLSQYDKDITSKTGKRAGATVTLGAFSKIQEPRDD